MRFSRSFFLCKRFLTAKKWQYFLVFLGLVFGTFFFSFFLSLTQGVKTTLTDRFSQTDTFVTIQEHPSHNIALSEDVKNLLLQSDLIENIYTETAVVIPFTFDISIPFADSFSLDLYFLYGIEDRLFDSLLSHSAPQDSVPVLLNPLSVDLINSFVQSMMEGVTLSNSLFAEKTVSTTLGKSTFVPSLSKDTSHEMDVFVSGFSTLSPLVGVAIPLSQAREIQQIFNEDETSFSRFHIEPKSNISLSALRGFLEEEGFLVRSQGSASEKIDEMVSVVQWVLVFSSSTILFLSFLFLFSILKIVIGEHKKSMGVLEAMGTSKKELALLFGGQGLIVGVSGVCIGLLISLLALACMKIFWNASVSLFLFPAEIFTISPSLFLCVGLAILVALFATLFFALRKPLKTPILHNILGLS